MIHAYLYNIYTYMCVSITYTRTYLYVIDIHICIHMHSYLHASLRIICLSKNKVMRGCTYDARPPTCTTKTLKWDVSFSMCLCQQWYRITFRTSMTSFKMVISREIAALRKLKVILIWWPTSCFCDHGHWDHRNLLQRHLYEPIEPTI